MVGERKCVVKHFSLTSNTENVKKIISEELKKKSDKAKFVHTFISLCTV